MAYSNKKIPDDPTLFPPPQTWLAWIERLDVVRDAAGEPIRASDGTYHHIPSGEGVVRHHFSLVDARKYVRQCTRSYRARKDTEFNTSWRVYEWDGEKWVKQFEGAAGEDAKDSRLFQLKFSKQERRHVIDAKVEDATIASIMESFA